MPPGRNGRLYAMSVLRHISVGTPTTWEVVAKIFEVWIFYRPVQAGYLLCHMVRHTGGYDTMRETGENAWNEPNLI